MQPAGWARNRIRWVGAAASAVGQEGGGGGNDLQAFCHAIPETWHQMGVILAATDCLNWLGEVTGQRVEALMNELAEADLLLIAVPIYNFSIPAALKSWIDLICRDNVDGARAKNLAGQFKNKQAMIILTSNYTNAYADDDFATPYLKFIMKFRFQIILCF